MAHDVCVQPPCNEIISVYMHIPCKIVYKLFYWWKNIAIVSLKEGKDITDATIKTEITDAGYVVKSIARSDESFDVATKKIKDSK